MKDSGRLPVCINNQPGVKDNKNFKNNHIQAEGISAADFLQNWTVEEAL